MLNSAGLSVIGSLLFSAVLSANPVAVGFITLDYGAPIAGQNEVTINNYTGPAAAGFGCGSFDSMFPVCDALNFTNISLTVQFSSGPSTVLLVPGSFGPGTFVPVNFIFSSAADITSLSFAATIAPTSFLLSDNSQFEAGATVISDALIPGQNELSLLYVAPLTGAVPEPGTMGLLISGLVLAAIVRRAQLSV